jgi:hypothetical protein
MPGTHIDENVLDRYAMGTLPEVSIPRVEEHLLNCPFCQSRLVETDEFLVHFRAAAAQVDARPVPLWERFQHVSRLLWSGSAVVAAACMLVMISGAPQPGKSHAALVSMQSLRGPEARAEMSWGRPGILVFDLPVKSDHAAYAIEIVDTAGRAILQGEGKVKDGQLTFPVQRLARAAYWVRVYQQQPSRTLVAEYGLEAK